MHRTPTTTEVLTRPAQKLRALLVLGAATFALVGCNSASNSSGARPKGRQTSNATSVTSRPSAVGHRPTVSVNRAGVASMTLTF